MIYVKPWPLACSNLRFPVLSSPFGTGHFVAIVSQDFIRNYPRWIRENEQPLLAVFSTNGPSGRGKEKERENIQVGENSFALYRERLFDKETADRGSRC